MHAEHAQTQRMACGESAQAHQRTRRRQVQFLSQLDDFFMRARRDGSAADIQHRTFGFEHRRNRRANLFGARLRLRFVTAHLNRFRVAELYFLRGHVFRQVYENGAGASVRGDVKGFFDCRRKVSGVFNEVIVFGARARHACEVGFLKRIVADQMRRHLSRKND